MGDAATSEDLVTGLEKKCCKFGSWFSVASEKWLAMFYSKNVLDLSPAWAVLCGV